jgi:hypothetical protein
MTAAITRSADHNYTFDGQSYPGVTGILKILDKSDALMGWAARQTAEAAVRLMDRGDGENRPVMPLQYLMETVGPEGVIKALTARSSWTRDEAANIGTELHGIADKIVRGEDTGFVSPVVLERATLYAKWWEASGWTLRLSEAFVIHPGAGYGGTFDLLAKDRDGRTVLADVKTGKGIYREVVLQLTAYALAQYVSPVGSPTVYPMPAVDRYVVLHVTAKGVREVELAPIGDLEKFAWLACLDLYRWAESMKGVRL